MHALVHTHSHTHTYTHTKAHTHTHTHTHKHTHTHTRNGAGLDYTVAHYGIVTQDPRLDAVLCFVKEHPDDSSWDDGEVGVCVCVCVRV